MQCDAERMPRLTTQLDDEEYEWVSAESDRRDRSMSKIVADCVKQVMQSDADQSDVHHSDSHHIDALENELEELRCRVRALEQGSNSTPDSRERDADSREATGRNDESHSQKPKRQRKQSEATEDIAELLKGWPDSGERREAKRESAQATLSWLRDECEGRASGEDFRDALADEWALDGQSSTTWWRKVARPALQYASDDGLVEYRSGHYDYAWINR